MISFKISRPKTQDQKLKTKIGDQTMMQRIAREENQSTGRRPAFSTAEAIAMSRSVRNDVTLRVETFRYQARLHSVEYLARNDTATQAARVARGNAEEEARTQDMLGRCTGTRRDQDCAAQFAIRRHLIESIIRQESRGQRLCRTIHSNTQGAIALAHTIRQCRRTARRVAGIHRSFQQPLDHRSGATETH